MKVQALIWGSTQKNQIVPDRQTHAVEAGGRDQNQEVREQTQIIMEFVSNLIKAALVFSTTRGQTLSQTR